ncbi:hypothetical protein [Actibacterium lipolyticum]|uniref:Uncharacterized protein n=1 Tax=Actibacterium lipolyticum TaxID=1524263 RepID=A0A238JJW4_9RHOB|nr:hypothetical protein [Actibacterium lipolyticum]SMX30775.1 hypothetical protein COL8621_00114 [Actibacterium lipolyticum]
MRIWIALILLAACDSPSVGLINAPSRQVQIENSTFVVHFNGERAEAIRTNFEFGKEARGVMGRGYRAIELATGCQIVPRSFEGDPALMKAKLACVS